MEDGPCVLCGTTNYALSTGGPTICPSCDCGNYGIDAVRRQAKEITDLRTKLDVARRYAAAWKASAKSNRIGFAWWDACTDAAWSFSGTLSRVLCERFKIRIYVEPSPDAPHGGGYYTSANDRRDEIMATIDRIEKERDEALALLSSREGERQKDGR